MVTESEAYKNTEALLRKAYHDLSGCRYNTTEHADHFLKVAKYTHELELMLQGREVQHG